MRMARAVLYPSVIQIRAPIGAAAPGWHCLHQAKITHSSLPCRKRNVFFFNRNINCEIAAERNGVRKTPQENDRDELDGEVLYQGLVIAFRNQYLALNYYPIMV